MLFGFILQKSVWRSPRCHIQAEYGDGDVQTALCLQLAGVECSDAAVPDGAQLNDPPGEVSITPGDHNIPCFYDRCINGTHFAIKGKYWGSRAGEELAVVALTGLFDTSRRRASLPAGCPSRCGCVLPADLKKHRKASHSTHQGARTIVSLLGLTRCSLRAGLVSKDAENALEGLALQWPMHDPCAPVFSVHHLQPHHVQVPAELHSQSPGFMLAS